MGLFKSLKKAIKKIGKGIKKVVKKTVGAVKKVVKKVASSKILRAVVGGALLFTGVGGVLSRFMTSSSTGFFANWASKAASFAKGSSALGGIGQVFRPAYNLGQNIFSGAGPFGGQGMFSSPINTTGVGSGAGGALPVGSSGSRGGFKSFLGGAAKETGKDLIKAYARQEVFGEDPVGDAAGLSVEPDARLQPIEFAYQNLGVDSNNAYSNLTYGTADLGYISTPLYTQETVNIT
tara:strand:- start:9760 stop:10464 length:705 start_codon:yes stop_codon:yes gene_type:complete